MDAEPGDRLTRHHDAVPLRQLLRRKRRTEVGVGIAKKPLDLSNRLRGQAVVRPRSPLARYQTGLAISFAGPHKPLELTHADTRALNRLTLPGPLFNRRTDQLRTLRRGGTHQQVSFGDRTSPGNQPKGDILTLREGGIPNLR
jgi:hypothetical protein